MALIKTIDEFKEIARIPGTVNVKAFLPSVPDAQEKYLLPILGEELLSDLDTWYNLSTPVPVAVYSALLPYVQRALVRFTIFIASPELDVSLTDSGIGVIEGNNLVPASSDRVAKFDKSNEERGWSNIETLLRFLEKNKANYPEWVASSAYTMSIRNMVNSASEFNSIHNINESHLTFYKLRTVQDDVDNLYIKTVISAELFDRIVDEIKDGTITPAIAKILPQLRRAEVFFTVLDSMDKSKYDGTGVELNNALMQRDIEKYTNKAKLYLADVRAILDKTPTDYPEYADSDQYDDPDETYLYENTAEAKNYHFR